MSMNRYEYELLATEDREETSKKSAKNSGDVLYDSRQNNTFTFQANPLNYGYPLHLSIFPEKANRLMTPPVAKKDESKNTLKR